MLMSMLFYQLKHYLFVFWEKMANAFFNISRSSWAYINLDLSCLSSDIVSASIGLVDFPRTYLPEETQPDSVPSGTTSSSPNRL